MQNNLENNNSEISSLPFDDVWASLKPQLDKEAARREKRKKRLIVFWWFSAIGILVSAGMVMISSGNKSSLKAENQNKTISNKNELAKVENKDASIETAPASSKNALASSKNALASSKTALASSETALARIKTTPVSIETALARDKTALVSSKTALVSSKNALARGKTAPASIENALVSSKTLLVESKLLPKGDKTTIADDKTTLVGSKISLKDTKNTEEKHLVTSNEVYNNESLTKNTNEKQEIVNELQVTINNEQATGNKKSKTPNNKQETKNEKQQTTNKKQKTNFAYGLQWNLPLQNGLQYNDINANTNSLLVAIPQFWVSKQLGKKHSVMLSFNPYSQYFVSNKAVANSSYYEATFYSGSQVDNKPETIKYTEANLFNKLIAIEAALTYQYQLSSKIKIGVGIGNNWVQGVLLKNKVVKQNTILLRDSLYGINKNDADWSYVKHTFLLGKIEMQYQFNKLQVGVCFSKPISSMFNNIEESKTPINTNLFLRWKIK